VREEDRRSHSGRAGAFPGDASKALATKRAEREDPIGHRQPRAMARPKALLSWSSGKDSAWALHVLRQQGEVEIVGLLTTVNEHADRVAMHAVRRSLLKVQAEAAGVPLWTVPIPHPCSNEQYEAAMTRAIQRARAEDVDVIAFGDLFLEDVRRYRETRLADTGLRPVFPLWMRPTSDLAREMLRDGLRAILTCVDPAKLPASFAGRVFSPALIPDLPSGVDPCGENGEFHTFAFAGPMFERTVEVHIGEVVERDGFVFADVTPRKPTGTRPAGLLSTVLRFGTNH
jgi:uncharacterized protein (TIGR00290 family)